MRRTRKPAPGHQSPKPRTVTLTFAAAPARSRTLPRASRAPHSKMLLNSTFSEKIQITFVSHLVENGVDPTFVQRQAGHSWASSTAGYTTVGADHANRMLRAVSSGCLLLRRKGIRDEPGTWAITGIYDTDGRAGNVRHYRVGPAAGRTRVVFSREQVYRLAAGTPERFRCTRWPPSATSSSAPRQI